MKKVITIVGLAVTIIGGFVAFEARYITCAELDAHDIEMNNRMVNKELGYCIAREASLQAQLIHGQDDYKIRLELQSCSALCEAIRGELR
jgi:hypothetical protein